MTHTVATVAAVASFALAPMPAGAAMDTAVKRCGSLTVALPSPPGEQYEGGAASIRAKGTSCRAARRIARNCVLGERVGWDYNERRIGRWPWVVLTRGSNVVRYRAAGGGYCGPPAG